MFSCNAVSYVGMTQRHLQTKISEHQKNGDNRGPIRMHTNECIGYQPPKEDFEVLRKIQRQDTVYLSVIEALYIREHKPCLNTKDDFKGRMLRIKI